MPNKSSLIALSLSFIALAGVALPVQATAGLKPLKSGRVPANGIDYYYEIHGQGEPLLLLHGGMGSIEMFGPVLATLAKTRQVIAVDLHGHGRTALGTRPIEMPAMGDDLAVLLKALGYGAVDVLGYSMGADVGLRLAIQHPESVRRLALVSPAFEHDAYYPELLAMQAGVGATMAAQMKETPMYKSYVAVAPKPEDFPRFLDAIGVLMRTPYDWSAEVAKLAGPVMLVWGDSDMIRPEHMVKFYQLLGGGLRDGGFMREHVSPNRLAILPNRTHYDILDAPELLPTVLPFLNGDTKVKSLAE
ncbi:MAG: alpha/beta hydrolase [Thermoanaerobaculia bacterium]